MFIDSVKTVAYPKAERELAELNDYAKTTAIFKGDLKEWDLSYYKTQKGIEMMG